jgi:hypothetical protein
MSGGEHARGQSNLIALGVALLLVTAAAVTALAVAGGTFGAATRQPADRALAAGVAERVVSGPAAVAPNALDRRSLSSLNLSAVAPSGDVRVTLDGQSVAARGDPTDGVTVRRLVLVERRRTAALRQSVAGTTRLRLPARSRRAVVGIEGAGVEAVRVDNRTVRRNATPALRGQFTLDLPPDRRATLTFVARGGAPNSTNSTGSANTSAVTVTYFPWTTEPATLAVTADA